MGVAQDHGLGRNGRFYARRETTFASFLKPISGDAIKILKSTMDFKQARKPRNDVRQTRSLLERITGMKEVAWSVDSYLIPSGDAGVPPDVHELLRAAFGIYVNTPSVNDVYTLSDAQSALGSLSLVRTSDVHMQALIGAVVEEMKLGLAGGDEPKLSFSGFAVDELGTGTSVLTAAVVASATILIQASDVANFTNGSVLQVGVNTNGGAGYRVVSGGGTSTLVLETTLTAALGDVVAPFAPTETTSGSPIAGILGSLVFAEDSGAQVPITALEVTLKNGTKPVNNEAFQDRVTDYILGYREVTGSVTIRLRRDQVRQHFKRKSFVTRNLVAICGTVVGRRLQIDMPTIEVDFSPIEIPEAEEATFTLPFTALSSGVLANELKFTFF